MSEYFFRDEAYDLTALNEAEEEKKEGKKDDKKEEVKAEIKKIQETTIDNFGKKFIILNFLAPDDTWEKCKGDGDFDKKFLENVNKMDPYGSNQELTDEEKKAIETEEAIGILKPDSLGEVGDGSKGSEKPKEESGKQPAEQPAEQKEQPKEDTNDEQPAEQQKEQTTADTSVGDAIEDDKTE